MHDEKIESIANNANMIIKGYAFSKDENLIRVFNLNDGKSAMVISPDGTMLETNMDEIEQALVLTIWKRDSKYMEASNA
jgi:hypothetical protein